MITATQPSADTPPSATSADLLFGAMPEAVPSGNPEFMDFLVKHSSQPPSIEGHVIAKLAFDQQLTGQHADQIQVLDAAHVMQNLPVTEQATQGLPANFAAQRAVLELSLEAAQPPLSKAVLDHDTLSVQSAQESKSTEADSSAEGSALLAFAPNQPQGIDAERTLELESALRDGVDLASSSLGPLLQTVGKSQTAPVVNQLGHDGSAVLGQFAQLAPSQPPQTNPLAAVSVQASQPLVVVPVSLEAAKTMEAAKAAEALTTANPAEVKSALVVQGAQTVAVARSQIAPEVLGSAALNSDAPVSGENVASPASVAMLSADVLALAQLADGAASDKGLGGMQPPTAVSSAVVQSPLLASLGDSSTVSRAPIEPHLMRLDSGPVQVEVLKMVRQGGGQIVLELTPPDQGSYRIDLRLDLNGRAQLVIEGASDSVRTRLEQGEAGLKEQFAQMGLELQLNFRRNHDGQRLGQDADANSDEPSGLSTAASAADQRASRTNMGSTPSLVHLYA